MQNHERTIPVILSFATVPVRHRSDGWTPDRQRAFIAALAVSGSVTHAARAVNMAPEGAYQLRLKDQKGEFRAAWEAAQNHGVQRISDIALDRAVEGVTVPIFYKGEQVGERRRYNDRLLMFILRHHLPARYAPDSHKHRPAPIQPPHVDAAVMRRQMIELIEGVVEEETAKKQQRANADAPWLTDDRGGD